MPELPEVETARRIIESTLVGARLVATEVRLPKLLRYSDIPDTDALVGQTLLAARRRAKVLITDWSGELALLVHLKLSGQISLQRGGERRTAGHPVPNPAGSYPHKATHISFTFDTGWMLHMSDVRQFGWVRIMPADAVDTFIAAQKFGPEAVGPEGVSADQLATSLARRSIPVKLALLDQGVVAGLGNIYVDEALHRARIHPMTPARDVPPERIPELLAAIQWALETGIEQGGAKIIHNKAYPIDGFPEVHARKGEACPVCGDEIVKIKVGQRGTYLCPTCQPGPPGTV
jgi:formamidopyrimidine-DNA glycosylase